MPRSLGDDRRRDHVDVAEHRPEQAGERGRGQAPACSARRRRRHIRSRLPISRAVGELAGKGAELLGKRDEGRRRGASSAEIEGMLSAFETAPRDQEIGRSARRSAARHSPAPRWSRRRDAACTPRARMAEQRVAGRRLVSKTSKAAPATWPESSAAFSALSIHQAAARAIDDAHAAPSCVAIAAASMMLRVLSVSGVCSEMKSARAQQLVERRPSRRRARWRAPATGRDRRR